MYDNNLAFNNLQWLIYHKTKPTHPGYDTKLHLMVRLQFWKPG